MAIYSVFLRHETGIKDVLTADADAAMDAVNQVQPMLGAGWKAVGALEKNPELEKVDLSSTGKPAYFGVKSIQNLEAPRFVSFNFDELTCFHVDIEHVQYIFLLKQRMETERGWGYFLWENGCPREKAVEWLRNSPHKESIYALYEKRLDGTFSIILDLRKTIHGKKYAVS